MQYIVVSNSGEIDLRELELIGATSKEGNDAVRGMFGSGIKYAIAQALRQGIELIITSGTRKVQFSTSNEVIRGVTHERIIFSVNNGDIVATSLTTGMGKQDWQTPWFILREFISNAADEGDYTLGITNTPEGTCGMTNVFIQATSDLASIYRNLTDYFKAPAEALESIALGRIYSSNSDKCRIFKKGVFVQSLHKQSIWNYDIKELTLSESRIADTWDIKCNIIRILDLLPIARKVQLLKTIAFESQSEIAWNTAEYIYIESTIDSSYLLADSKKPEWKQAFELAFPDTYLVANNAIAIAKLQEAHLKTVILPTSWEKALRKCGVKQDIDVLGAKADEGKVIVQTTKAQQATLRKAVACLKASKHFRETTLDTPIEIFATSSTTGTKQVGYAHKKESDEWTIGIREDILEESLRLIVETLLEEYCHVETGYLDYTLEFQDWIFRQWTKDICKGEF